MTASFPRIVVAGTGGDSGKTLVSLGLTWAWRDGGISVCAFKKGPDYIDAAWLAWAAGSPARNLDSYLMGFDGVRQAFTECGDPRGVNVIEGNRGLYDGAGPEGTHSTAALARALDAPVVVALDVTKSTRTVAALVQGLKNFEPDTRVAGVVLNRVAGARHEQVIRRSIEETCGIPVLGAIPRLRGGDPLPGRHLGLVTVDEHGGLEATQERLLGIARDHLDLPALMSIARSAGAPPAVQPATTEVPEGPFTVGVLRDSAFTFYYPENLEALERAGGELVFVSALDDPQLPELDGLYIGGGFPETHGQALADNRSLMRSVRSAADDGLPIYAECGGLMVLSRSIRWKREVFPMAGVLPLDIEMERKPQGHGYCEVEVDRDNPYLPAGTILRGHEFHYSRVISGGEDVPTALKMLRGSGAIDGRDGFVRGQVMAAYLHLHARGTPAWAKGFAAVARTHRNRTRTSSAIRL